jgi:hypothetical protein
MEEASNGVERAVSKAKARSQTQPVDCGKALSGLDGRCTGKAFRDLKRVTEKTRANAIKPS